MRILIVGSRGQVGRALEAAAGAAGHKVFGADVKSSGAQLILDLADMDSVKRAMKAAEPDFTALCSAMTHVDGCEKEPASAWKINAEAPGGVAALCRDAGSGLVYFSTEYVFDGKNGPYSETDAPNPVSVYGRAKLEGERRILAVMQDALVVRTTVVYSFDPDGRNFVMQLLDNYSRGIAMRVPRDQYSNPTYAPELAEFILELAAAGKSGVYNVAGIERLNRYEFALKVCEAFGFKNDFLKPVATSELNQPAPRPLNAGLKMDKLISVLGRAPAGTGRNLKLMAARGGARK